MSHGRRLARHKRIHSFASRRLATVVISAAALLVTSCGLVGNDDSVSQGTVSQDSEAGGQPSTTITGSTTSTAARSETSSTQPPSPQAGGESIGDPLFPGLGNTGYQVDHYDLELNVTGADLRAEADIRIIPDVPLTSFNLDLVGMTVDRVLVNGIEASIERDGRELIVHPATTVQQDQPSQVRVLYHGVPQPIDDPSGPIELGWHTEPWGTFVASEPLGAATWFPANDHQQDKATFRMEITVPAGQTAAGPGLLVSELSTSPSTSTFVWEMDEPMAPYLASVVTGDFTISTAVGIDGVVLRNVLPADQTTQLLPALASTNEMLAEFSQLFGAYPYDSYGVVAVPEDLRFALENQTLSLFDTNFLTLRRRTVENVLAHELAHQWFGNNVSPTTWDDIWLSEGFASWADHYWTELDGGLTFDDRAAIATQLNLGPPTDVESDSLFSDSVYLRGALTLEALRRTTGNDEFFTILETWGARFGGGTASTDDFLDLVRQHSGTEAESVVRSFLFDPFMPQLPVNP